MNAKQNADNPFLADLESTIPDLENNLETAAAAADTSDNADAVRGQLTTAANAMRYALAGKATITLVSRKTGTRFSYRVSANDDGTCHFVGVLVGQNNETDYKYLGRISRGMFWQGRKVPRAGDIRPDAPSAKAFAWAWRAIVRGTLPEALEVWHESACGRCGRKLTVPSSVSQGFGPECINKIGLG